MVGRIEVAQLTGDLSLHLLAGGRRINGETHMKRTFAVVGMLLVLFAANAGADDKAALITLDKQWGEAVGKGDKTAAAKFIADDSVSIDDRGMKNKRQQIDDIKPAPAGEKYEAVDYK